MMDDAARAAWAKAFREQKTGPQLVASLVAVVMEIGPPDDGALREHNGRRSFAAELLRLAGAVGPYGPPAPPKPKDERLPGRRIGPEES